MKTLIKILCLSMLWFSCESSTEPEGETVELWGVSYSINNTVELDLTSSGLSGEIPIEIGELINLEKLDLKSNNLIGDIPSSLSNLENLIELNLYNNQLTGELDSTITKLTNLQYLTLESNQFSGSIPEHINNLSNLIGLDLRDNNFSGELPIQINELLLLENLYLHGNAFCGQIDPSICFLSKCYPNTSDNNDCPDEDEDGRCDDCPDDYLGSLDFTSYEYFNIDNNQFLPPYPECMTEESDVDANNDGEIDQDSFGNQNPSVCP
tara:strand:+ start:170 stop:967 length:798 start_codon:yes stop_codon:yes gene_type:complete